MKDHVSVVLVNWNGMAWLKQCLDSLYDQTYKNVEVVIVDNASTDNSVQFIKQHYPQVALILRSKNEGFGVGCNAGVLAATGSHILILNTDTWLNKHTIETLMEFKKEYKYDVVAPLEADYKGEPRQPYTTKIDPFGFPVYTYSDQAKQDNNFYLTGVCLLFEKQLFLDSRGFDENFFMYCEEVDWFWRLHLQRKRVAYCHKAAVNHAGSAADTTLKPHIFLWRNQNTLQMLLKNYSLHNLIWAVPLYLLQNVAETVVFLIALKPHIARTYISGWFFNIYHFRRTMRQRRLVQNERNVGDFYILRKMYRGNGKLRHMTGRIQK